MSGYYDGVRMDMVELINKSDIKKILEVGGGNFSTLSFLKSKYNSNCVGVDIHEGEHANDFTFIKGSVEDELVKSNLAEHGKFDLIMANDVLEHLVDTEQVLKYFFDIMEKDGILLVSVPNIRQIRCFYHIFIRGSFPRTPSGMFDSTHLRWFCLADIKTMVEDAGFVIEQAFNDGRLVPKIMKNTIIGQLLGLHNKIQARKC